MEVVVLKGLILWTAFVFFLYLAITALDMGEYTIAAVMGLISVGCLLAAPSGAKKKDRDAEPARWRR